jgi:hypothetical protein
MQIITSYNSPNTPGFDIPIAEMLLNQPAAHGIIEEFRLLTEWDALASVGSGGTTALSADSFAGEVTLTPNGTGGCHLEMKTESFNPGTSSVFMLCRAKFNTAGQYFIGLTQKNAASSYVITSNALRAGTGAGFLIQTDNRADIISRDVTPTDLRTQDITAALAVDTYHTFGIILDDTQAQFFVNGKKVGQIAIATGMGSGTAKHVTPSFEANTNAKVLTVDYCVVAQQRT